MSTSPVIVALDFPNEAKALSLVDQLDTSLCRLKVGKELFTRLGPAFVEKLVGRGFDVFLDLKFHDIPNTVAAACDAAADLGVWMMNLHASGGRKMMQTARERLEGKSHRPKLIAVTILTSLGEEDIHEIGFSGTPGENVLRLATLAESAGLDGVVCSPLEAAAIREQAGQDFLLVTPGVRPASASLDDQKRVMTPAEAMAAGSSCLVIGRPVTAAPDPLQALKDINASL
ncbi:orotidine-5'-phosphate decarboxylase [Thiolapillus sp.]|uniref:orotidine-5'-phosphate decarboxylase n=3 Tax=Thiolapillus sp. TaxID=2017437 RepID=UPI0025EF2BC8|nr:orotidine-5'-phosphate decarboxylase [Thiolapillus sp.]